MNDVCTLARSGVEDAMGSIGLREVEHGSQLSRFHRKVKPDDGLNSMARNIGSRTPLGGAGVWSDTLQAGREDWIVGLAFSDQTGTLLIEQGIDGQNWDFDTSIAVTGGTGKEFKVEIYAPFIKLTYTNGATPQTEFRLGARFSSAGNR